MAQSTDVAAFIEIFARPAELARIGDFAVATCQDNGTVPQGAATESFHPDAEGIANLSPKARTELYTIFPALRVGGHCHDAAFTTPRSWELMACVA